MIVAGGRHGPWVLLVDKGGVISCDVSPSPKFTDMDGEAAPKIRCRAAWYCASRSAYDFCCESGAPEEAAETDGVGRFNIRKVG